MKTLIPWIAATVFVLGCTQNDASEEDSQQSVSTDDSDSSEMDTLSTSQHDSALDVPRPFEDGVGSFLDNQSNADWGKAGVCPALEVYCNDTCLTEAGDQEGNCTLMMHKTDETESIALNSEYVFYLSGMREVLKTDLDTLETTSVLSGLAFPECFTANEERVFATTADYFGGVEGVVASDASGDHPVVVLDYTRDIDKMDAAGERVFFIDFFNHTLMAFPAGGGAVEEAVSNDDYPYISDFATEGEYLYFSVDMGREGGLHRAPLANLSDVEAVWDTSYIDSFCIAGNHAYWANAEIWGDPVNLFTLNVDTQEYTQTEMPGNTFIIACNKEHAIYILETEEDQTTTELRLFSFSDAATQVLGTIETRGIDSAVANDTHVYLAVGNSSTGGIIRFELP